MKSVLLQHVFVMWRKHSSLIGYERITKSVLLLVKSCNHQGWYITNGCPKEGDIHCVPVYGTSTSWSSCRRRSRVGTNDDSIVLRPGGYEQK